MLDPVIHKMITYVQNLEEKDLKDKVVFYKVCFPPTPDISDFQEGEANTQKSVFNFLITSIHSVVCLVTIAAGEHPRPAVGHQAFVYEVPERDGHGGGWPAAWHVATHAQNPPFLHQDELPQRGEPRQKPRMSRSTTLWHPPTPAVVLQVTKLIEESTVAKTVKNAIDTDKLLDWLVENSVLSIALEGKKCDQQELAPRLRTVAQTNKIEYKCGMIRVCH